MENQNQETKVLSLIDIINKYHPTGMTLVFEAASEQEKGRIIDDFENNQLYSGFTVKKGDFKHHCKIDKKSGEVIEEGWKTTVAVTID